jgi:hypothetical protein
MSLWTSAVRAISHGEKHVLKGVVRGKQAPEMRCLAETRHGDSQEARRALRGISTLTYLACDVSQWSQKPPGTAAVWTESDCMVSIAEGSPGQPVLP